MPHTLLLADDSVTIQRVIELTFADEDVQVVAVSDGDQAIERLEASPPDIVLADIGMPGKNGYEVAQYMKQSPKLAHIPVLLLTGAFEPVDQARVAEAGCDGVLAKPFEPNLVIDRVRDLLSQPRQPRSDVHRAAPPPTPPPPAVAPAPSPASGLAPMLPSDFWAPPPPSSSAVRPAGQPPSKSVEELDDYFDRLDAAFNDLGAEPPPDLPKVAPFPTPAPQATVPDEIDWFGHVDAPAPDLPLAVEPPPLVSTSVPEAIAPRPAPISPAPTVAAPAVAEPPVPPLPPPAPAPRQPAVAAAPPPAAPPPLPSLADAFAALLAAEQGEPLPPVAPGWPMSTAATAAVPGDIVEQVTKRVLAALSDRVVRETVSDLVASIAERLVREEIARIKASVK